MNKFLSVDPANNRRQPYQFVDLKFVFHVITAFRMENMLMVRLGLVQFSSQIFVCSK